MLELLRELHKRSTFGSEAKLPFESGESLPEFQQRVLAEISSLLSSLEPEVIFSAAEQVVPDAPPYPVITTPEKTYILDIRFSPFGSTGMEAVESSYRLQADSQEYGQKETAVLVITPGNTPKYVPERLEAISPNKIFPATKEGLQKLVAFIQTDSQLPFVR